MALNSNPFVEGIDPTSTFGGYASVLLQLIRQAIPSSTYGMILFDTTPPDVTGSNAWRKTCLWISLANPAEPALYVYKTSSPGWVNINDIISPNSIVTAMIANGAVTLAKLSVAGGTANQLIRVNAGETGFEFVSLASLVTTGSIPVGSLITTGIPGGQFRLAGTYGPSVANWYTAENVIDNIPTGYIAADLIAPAPGSTSRSKFITSRTADTFGTWRFLEPNTDIIDNSLSGAKLAPGTVDLAKITVPGGTAEGDYVGILGGVLDFIPRKLETFKYTNQVALPAAGVDVDVITYAATGGKADIYQFTFVCVGAEHGYAVGDEVPIASWGNDDASNEAGPLVWFDASTSKVIHTGPVNYQLQQINGGRTAINTPTRGNWNLKVTAIRFA